MLAANIAVAVEVAVTLATVYVEVVRFYESKAKRRLADKATNMLEPPKIDRR